MDKAAANIHWSEDFALDQLQLAGLHPGARLTATDTDAQRLESLARSAAGLANVGQRFTDGRRG